jgi:methionyl-tRNA formyltransferase
MRIWFIGGGGFAASCLSAMSGRLRFEKIVTNEPTKAGRGLRDQVSAVEKAAQGLPVERTGPLRRNEALKRAMISDPPDLAFVVDFGQIIEEPFLNGPRHGCLNIHPSLLPRWRGAAPVQRAILNGDTETGVTVFRLVKELDAGPILAQVKVPAPISADSAELLEVLASRGSKIALHSVESIIEGSCQFSEQNSEFATYADKLDKGEARISWNRDSFSVHNTARAFACSFGAFVTFRGKRLKLWRTSPVEVSRAGVADPRVSQSGETPGTVLFLADGDPVVACESGAVRLMEVQNEGGRRVSGGEWLRGSRLKEGDVLTTD